MMPFITDEVQMVELMKLIQQNPDQAAKILAATGMTPDQLTQIGSPGVGQLVPTGDGILNSEPRLASAGFTPGPLKFTPPAPTDQFTLPGEGEPPMPKVVETTNLAQGPDPMMDYQWNQALPIESAPAVGGPWATTVTPAAAGGQNLGALMAGLKQGGTQSADQRPIFGANAPAPKAPQGVTAGQNSASMQAILQLLQGRGAAGQVPTLGMLMR